MGFRSADSNEGSVIINIGQASTYRDATGNFSLSVGNLDAALSLQFGGAWDTRADLYVGVAGSPSNTGLVNGDPLRTIYASNAQTTFGTESAAWSIGSGARGTTSTLMQGIDNGFLAGADSANLDNGATQVSTESNWWGSYMAGGANATGGLSFSQFNPGIEASFAGGASTVALDLFRVLNSNTGATEPGTVGTGQYSGTFTFTDTGIINYSTVSASAVPEPSRALLMAFGLASFVFRRRRRASVI